MSLGLSREEMERREDLLREAISSTAGEELEQREGMFLEAISVEPKEDNFKLFLSPQEKAVIGIMRDTDDGRLDISIEGGEPVRMIRYLDPDISEELDIF